MPVIASWTPDDARAVRDARDEAVATMSALAPMTRIGALRLPVGRTATIARHDLGPVALAHLEGLAYDQVATTRTIDGVPAGISLAVRPSGTWVLSQAGTTRSSATRDVVGVVDVTRAMHLRTAADTPLLQLYLSADQLGMDIDTLRTAAALVDRSPLRTLVAHHVLALPPAAGVPDAAARRSVGLATIEVVRAMLLGAARPEQQVGAAVSAEHLRACIRRYVGRRLHDPALSPATIADAHAVSRRYLYDLWRDEPTTLARWITLRRLQAVREDLADPRLAHRSVARIAHAWCFTNPTSFARRFRTAYGMTPREWRRLAAPDP
ncbi:helix-turn-helix transcriptional regulator [Actinomycetospora sp. CA-101289]|uniref:helix-turn-helix transcriptional regulator n=1 Tax=Actinomycetospora sp. CA-101289 TaxID=3239893 RepID=UPI003D99B4CF